MNTNPDPPDGAWGHVDVLPRARLGGREPHGRPRECQITEPRAEENHQHQPVFGQVNASSRGRAFLSSGWTIA
jgi:hypothetical protein